MPVFMNLTTIKYNKIVTTENGFKGSVHTVTEDIVALMDNKKATNSKRRKPVNDDGGGGGGTNKQKKMELPKWVRHYISPTGTKCKLGDTNEFNGDAYHFYDAPTHMDQIKWYTHSHSEYRPLGTNTEANIPTGNVVDVPG